MFIVAPLLGGGLAAAVYRALRSPTPALSTREAEEALESQQRQRLREHKERPV
jgi:aquaporin Z